MEVVDIKSFMPIDAFKARIAALASKVHQNPLAEGVTRIYLPGEIEAAVKKERLRSGVPLSKMQQEELVGLAKELGIKTRFLSKTRLERSGE